MMRAGFFKTTGGGGGDGGAGGVDTAIIGLLRKLPTQGSSWTSAEQARFLAAFTHTVQFLYPTANDVASHSPISLTPVGQVMSDKIGANKILTDHLDSLVREVEVENPKNAYDIQMVSMKVAKEKMLSFLNEQNLNAIKDEAFSKGILVEDVMSIFGVLLRNHILNKKGIPIADVDKHVIQEVSPPT